jgi:hypothetical protein
VNFALVGVQAAEWTKDSLADGETVFACTGDTVTLAWEYVLGEGETPIYTKWNVNDKLPVAANDDISNRFHTFLPTFNGRYAFTKWV